MVVSRTRLSLAADIWSLGVLLLHLLPPAPGQAHPDPTLPPTFILSKAGRPQNVTAFHNVNNVTMVGQGEEQLDSIKSAFYYVKQ